MKEEKVIVFFKKVAPISHASPFTWQEKNKNKNSNITSLKIRIHTDRLLSKYFLFL